MTKSNFLRNVVAIAICLATATGAQAQIRNAIRNAANSVRNETRQAASNAADNATEGVISDNIAAATLTPAQRDAIAKLQDESNRTAPKVKELCDYQRDYELIRNWFGKEASKPVGAVQTVESAQAFKAAIEARTAENREIFCALFQVPDNYDCSKLTDDYDFSFRGNSPNIKDEVRTVGDAIVSAGEKLREELENYQAVLEIAADLVPRGKIVGDIQTGAEITIDDLRAGNFRVGQKDGKFVFINMAGQVAPCDNDFFETEITKYNIVLTLLRKENSETQLDQYWLASSVRGRLFEAQRNSGGMQEKRPVPASQMNNATLNAKMLKLAQEKYQGMGIVKIVIIESAWRPIQNQLGQIIHRTINTSAIYSKDGGYSMTTVSFIEPYAGGGNYGEVQAYGIGTDIVAVDYKP